MICKFYWKTGEVTKHTVDEYPLPTIWKLQTLRGVRENVPYLQCIATFRKRIYFDTYSDYVDDRGRSEYVEE